MFTMFGRVRDRQRKSFTEKKVSPMVGSAVVVNGVVDISSSC